MKEMCGMGKYLQSKREDLYRFNLLSLVIKVEKITGKMSVEAV